MKRLGKPAKSSPRNPTDSLGGRHCLRRRRRYRRFQTVIQKLHDLLHPRATTPLEEEDQGLSSAVRRGDDQILGKKLRLPRSEAAAELDRLRARAPTFLRDEEKFGRIFVRRDQHTG